MTSADLMPLLSFASTIALGVGAYFFKKLDSRMETLAESVGDLKTQCAVLAVSQEAITELKRTSRQLEERLRALESQGA